MALPVNFNPFSNVSKFGPTPASVMGLQVNTGPNPSAQTLLNSGVILSNVAIVSDFVPNKHPELETELKKVLSYGAVLFTRIFPGSEKPGATKGVWIHAAQLNTLFKKQQDKIDALLNQKPNVFTRFPIALLTRMPKQHAISLNTVYQPIESFDQTTTGLKKMLPNVFTEFEQYYGPEIMLTPTDVLNRWGFGGVLQQIRNDPGLGQSTVNVGGVSLITNYWKKLNTSMRGDNVGFIIGYIKESGKTRLNIREWSGSGIPDSKDFVSYDYNGFQAGNIYLQIGCVTDWQNFHVKPSLRLLSPTEDESIDQLNGNGSFITVNIKYAIFSI